MSGTITVRTIERADQPAWLGLWEGYNVFYGRSGPTALVPQITEATWSRFFDHYEPMHALVAERTGDLLGFVHFLYHRSSIQLMPVCYLEDLFTLQSARGQGVARALIEAVYDRARAAGVKNVYWQTHESNTVAMRLYDKIATRFGFIVYDKAL